jgi:hypothetical protein
MVDYAYGIRLDSEGSATAIGTAADNVRIIPEVAGGIRGRPTTIANRHGQTAPTRSFIDSYDFIVEVTLAYAVPETGTTVYTNRSTVLKRFLHHLERVWLTRTAPYQGTVEIPIMVTRPIRTGNPRHRLMIPCRALDPFWRDTSVTFSAVNPVSGVTVGGDAPIADGVFVFSGYNGAALLTHTTSGDTITVNTDTTANAVTVDLGAGTVKQSAAHVDGVATMAEPWGIELQPGSNTFTLSNGTATFTGRDKWL